MIDDEKIIEMFFERSEQAVRELDNKYGKICHHLSFNILNNRQDAEECVNDAYMGAWNAIPPARPHPLFPYIVKIVRNISLKLYWRKEAAKRNGHYIDMSVYVSIGTSDTYQQIAQILDPELMEKDAILSEYVSKANGIAAKFAVYDTIGRASAYFVNDGILYNISVGGFVDEDNVDPANYLKELIDTFK